MDNANVGRYLDACSFEFVRGYVFAGISAFLFGQTPPRCIGGTTLRRVTKPCCAYKKGSIYDENSIDHCLSLIHIYIVAKIMNKYLHIELGRAMSLSGMCVALSAALVYDKKTVVLSVRCV